MITTTPRKRPNARWAWQVVPSTLPAVYVHVALKNSVQKRRFLALDIRGTGVSSDSDPPVLLPPLMGVLAAHLPRWGQKHACLGMHARWLGAGCPSQVAALLKLFGLSPWGLVLWRASPSVLRPPGRGGRRHACRAGCRRDRGRGGARWTCPSGRSPRPTRASPFFLPPLSGWRSFLLLLALSDAIQPPRCCKKRTNEQPLVPPLQARAVQSPPSCIRGGHPAPGML